MKPSYQSFIRSKSLAFSPCGFTPSNINSMLMDYQSALVRRALEQGRFCLWAECGLGKSAMQLEWARHVALHTNKPVLIVAPLAVCAQTSNIEAPKFGVECTIAIAQEDIESGGVYITNYEKLSKFDYHAFGGIVLDESSILKSSTGATRNQIIEFSSHIDFRLACSATPSPNDLMELGSHSEFVGILSYAEMLAVFFTHDGGDTSKWRLKGHTQKKKFWEWVASWAVMVRSPADIGFDGTRHCLPAMHKKVLQVDTPVKNESGMLFAQAAQSLSEQRKVAKLSIEDRCKAAADLVLADPNRQWLVWCNLNAESEMLSRLINGAVEITGSTKPEKKVSAMQGFQNGDVQVLVTKPSIAGFGMNWQNCQRMIFVGLNHSYEQFYQASKRCHRFGQKDEVIAWLISHRLEGNILKSIERKANQAESMAANMAIAMGDASDWNYGAIERNAETYKPMKKMILPAWLAA